MMAPHIRNGFRAGTVFGIVIIFLVMIGFTVTASALLGDLLPSTVNLMILLGLLGLWGGARGAAPLEEDTRQKAVLGGLVAGITCGALVAILALILGLIDASGIDVRSYLVALTPTAIDLFMLETSPFVGPVIHLALMCATGALGGILAFSLRHGAWRTSLSDRWASLRSGLVNHSLVQKGRQNPYIRYAFYGVLLVLLFLLPQTLGQYWNYALGTVGIYVLLGLGLNIVVGLAGLLDLGYVAFFAIGAYTVALLTAPNPHNLLWSFWVALPIGILMAGLSGVLLGIPVLRMRGDYLAIVTLGFGEIIRILSKSDMLTGFSGGPRGVRDIGGPALFGASFNSERDFMYLIIVGIILVIFVTSRVQNSRVGRAWIAMREDETVAQAMGINTLYYKLLAFAIGAAFAGLGGVMFASRNQFTGPEDHTLMVSINVLSVVIVGGMGSIPGVVLGAFALKGLPEFLRQLENFRILAFGALLVVMMVILPEGLWPARRRQAELAAARTQPVGAPPQVDDNISHGGGGT